MLEVKPLLACEVEPDKLKFPLFISRKLDGIRALVINGVVYSRSLKPIRNKRIQKLFGRPEFEGFDGELVAGNVYAKDVFQKTTHAVMSEAAEEDVTFYVFDLWDIPNTPYEERLKELEDRANFQFDGIKVLQQVLVWNEVELGRLLQVEKEKGGEGLIGRNPEGRYKYGRSTPKEQLSVKFKFFQQDEFVVAGFTERMHNTNEAETNELGRTKRSSAKAGLVPMGTLGSLILKYGDVTFNCGTGFTDEQRQTIWDNQDEYLGKLASIRYMVVGSKDLPRVPSWQGWRDLEDMS